MPLLASNFVSNSLQGTVVVDNGWANVNLKVEPFALEGNKSFVIKLRKDGFSGPVLSTSAPITITDNSTVATVTANVNSIAEGNLVQFTVTTTNVINNANLFFSVLPRTANITSADFTANTGKVTIVNNTGIFALQANADLSLMDETGETFAIQIRSTSSTGNVVFSNLSNITILDVSAGYNILSFVENSSTVAEGGTLTLTFNATNIPVGTVFHYFTEGNATVSTFTGGNTGSFVMNGFSNTVTLLPTGVPYGTTQNFNVKLRALSNTGAVVATSNNIIAIDSSIAYMSATGGTITDSGEYRIHAFTTSGNLTINSLGAGTALSSIEYLAIAGGGAGYNNVNNGYGGSGGGAGGLINSSFVATTTGNTTITIGAGGAGANDTQNNGSNTTILGDSTTIIAVGGGSGGWNNESGLNGGSGGGAGQSPTARTAASGYGYPSPTQQGYPGSTSGPGLFHGGGGGAGQAGQNGSAPTAGAGGMGAPISWAPSLYGTTGPGPGRYFSGGGGGGSLSDFGNPAGGAGGAGGGGAGQGQSGPVGFAGNVNTGGGGGGRKGLPGTPATAFGGGSGIVLIRYPYVAPITISNVLTTANVFSVGSNIIFTINAQNANLTTLYYSTDGNVNTTNFIGGNTGSFVANASGGIVTLQANTNIPLDESRQFRLQIRQDSTTGFISGSSANVTIDGYGLQISATGGTITTSGGYRTHTFTDSGTLTVTKVPQVQGNVEILLVAGGGGRGGVGPDSSFASGGGGGGGVLYRANATLVSQPYPIVVGGGGGALSGGTPTTGFSVVSSGGGAGGNTPVSGPPQAGLSGGNGGGGGQPGGSGGPSNQNSYGGWFKYGNAGNPQTGDQAGGPGGSAGATFSISGAPVTYAAGGESTRYTTAPAVVPGSGNGGWASRSDSPNYPTRISNGAPGIVIIRYPYS